MSIRNQAKSLRWKPRIDLSLDELKLSLSLRDTDRADVDVVFIWYNHAARTSKYSWTGDSTITKKCSLGVFILEVSQFLTSANLRCC